MLVDRFNLDMFINKTKPFRVSSLELKIYNVVLTRVPSRKKAKDTLSYDEFSIAINILSAVENLCLVDQ